MEDPEGREECPPEITSVVLTAGANQYLCLVVSRFAAHVVARPYLPPDFRVSFVCLP
jgi:hypothetical protein